MKFLNRNFSSREKTLLLVLALFLLGGAYYFLVHEPVTAASARSKHEISRLSAELDEINETIAQNEKMQSVLDKIFAGDETSVMESYNNIHAELEYLNDILDNSMEYTISFDDVSRKGNQVRRGFKLQFTADTYDDAKELISKLYDSPYRCLIDTVDLKASNGNIMEDPVAVSLTAVFYETMVGGRKDAGLPEDKKKE